MDINDKHIVAIDLGTSKIALTVAKVNGEDIQVIYYKETPSAGIRYSSVFNVLHVTEPLRGAIRQAEEELGIKITQAVVGMPKFPIRQESSNAEIHDRGHDTDITPEDVDNLKDFAKSLYPLEDETKEAIYGAVAQSFSDGENFQIIESDIIGMTSDTLEGNFKIFIGKKNDLTKIDTVMTRVEVAAMRKYFTAESTAKAVLTNSEMENGVALIDFGGGSTSVSIYHGNIMRHYASIPFGGKNITHDIKTECQISETLAENIKQAFGACMPEKLLNMSEKVLHIMDRNAGQDKQVAVKYLSEIVTARVEEIIEAVLYEIQESGLAEHLRCGIVITGGTAQTANIANLINEMSGYKVRIGYPKTEYTDIDADGTHDTTATTVLGLVRAALKEEAGNCAVDSDRPIIVETVNETVNEEPEETTEEVEEVTYEETEQEEVVEHEEQEEEVQEKVKTDRWKFLKVVWGKAQDIGANINKLIDGITVDDEDETEDDE